MSKFDAPRAPWGTTAARLYGVMVQELGAMIVARARLHAAQEADDPAAGVLRDEYALHLNRHTNARYALWAAGWTEEDARRRDELGAIREVRRTVLEVARSEHDAADRDWAAALEPYYREQGAPSWAA